MGRRIWIAGAALPLAVLPAMASAEPAPIELAPTTPWNVHYADDYCRLARFFGTGKQRVTLVIEQVAPGDSFRMTLAGSMLDGIRNQDEAALTFGSLPEQKIFFFPGSLGKDEPAWIFGSPIRIRPYSQADEAFAAANGYYDPTETSISEAEEASATSLLIGRPLRKPVRLKTGPMTAALTAMRSCTDELLDHWGIDVARYHERSRSPMPIGNPGKWLRGKDYPAEMLAKAQPGIVQFRLSIGADGAPSACHIQRSTNAEGFNDAVCKGIMRRARFEPALDKDGAPLASYYVNAVRFQF